MPGTTVSHSLFDVQLEWNTREIPSYERLIKALLSILPILVQKGLRELLEARLEEDLGPKYNSGNRFEEKECPECESSRANRKEWPGRTQSVKKLGEVTIKRPQVTCQKCGATWRPYDKALGLAEGGRFGLEGLIESIREAIQTTYDKASDWMEEGPSPMTIWRHLNQWQPEPPDDSGGGADKTTVCDGTKIPGWKTDEQMVLAVAHDISRGPEKFERPTLRRDYRVGTAGDEQDIKDPLRKQSVEKLIHDGALQMEGIAREVVRCAWHVPHTVRTLLYTDGISGQTNKRWLQELREEIWDETSVKNRRHGLARWVNRHQKQAPRAAEHVLEAIEELLNYHRNPDEFSVQTTSPLERWMWEIDKRFENGGGWTKSGAEAMLNHHELLHHHPEYWETEMKNYWGKAMPLNN